MRPNPNEQRDENKEFNRSHNPIDDIAHAQKDNNHNLDKIKIV